MTNQTRSAFCAPNRDLMRGLTASDHYWRILDALGFSDDDLLPDSPVPGLDLRPVSFAVSGFHVDRLDPSRYLAGRRPMLGAELPSSDHLETKEIRAESEQNAGDQLLQFCPIRTGIHRQALERWLKLWGWTPPPPAV